MQVCLSLGMCRFGGCYIAALCMCVCTCFSYVSETSGRDSLLLSLALLVRVCWSQRRALVSRLLPFALLVLALLVFVVVNGGVAMGDKSHHQASLHLPQLFYFIRCK